MKNMHPKKEIQFMDWAQMSEPDFVRFKKAHNKRVVNTKLGVKQIGCSSEEHIKRMQIHVCDNKKNDINDK